MAKDSDDKLNLGATGSLDPLTLLDHQVQRGFLHSHTHLSQNRKDLLQTASTVFALVDLLVSRGLLDIQDVQRHVASVKGRLGQMGFGGNLEFALKADAPDKYGDVPCAEIDCAKRAPQCKLTCCSMEVPLARQDVEEEEVSFELGRPYYLRRGHRNYCAHLDLETGGCKIYDHRPYTCREYSCVSDTRIWKDFAGYVPNSTGIADLLERKVRPQLGGEALAARRDGPQGPGDEG